MYGLTDGGQAVTGPGGHGDIIKPDDRNLLGDFQPKSIFCGIHHPQCHDVIRTEDRIRGIFAVEQADGGIISILVGVFPNFTESFDLFLIQDFHETPFTVDAGGGVFTSGEKSGPLVIRIQQQFCHHFPAFIIGTAKPACVDPGNVAVDHRHRPSPAFAFLGHCRTQSRGSDQDPLDLIFEQLRQDVIQVLVPVDNEKHHFLPQFLELATQKIQNFGIKWIVVHIRYYHPDHAGTPGDQAPCHRIGLITQFTGRVEHLSACLHRNRTFMRKGS